MDIIKFILRLPFIVIRLVCSLLSTLFRYLSGLLSPIVGKLDWQAPEWWEKLSGRFFALENALVRHTLVVWLTLILLMGVSGGAFYGYYWWLNRPLPIEPAALIYQDVKVRVANPYKVNYNAASPSPPTVTLTFSHSAAPLADTGKAIDKGITLSPYVEGQWTWENDKTLVFTPAKVLPMGKSWGVTLQPDVLLAPQIRLSKTHYTFTSPAFDYQVVNKEYYQDPSDNQKRHAVFTVRFNAPVDVVSFEKRISMILTEGGNKRGRKIPFTLVYDQKKLKAWVHSQPLSTHEQGGAVHLTIGRDVKARVPSNGVSDTKSANVIIPARYSLTLDEVSTRIVDSDAGVSRKALLVQFNDAVRDKEVGSALKAWVLPQHNRNDPNDNGQPEHFYQWTVDNVDQEALSQSPPVKLTPDEGETDYQRQFSFTFDAPSQRYLLLEISNEITSWGGFKMPEKVWRVIAVPDFPKTLKFAAEGSLLSVSGEKKLSVAVRNVSGLNVDIRRVLPGQLQHVVSLKKPQFALAGFDRLNADYFTEHFQYQAAVNNSNPDELSYQGVDLSPYLSGSTTSTRGIFLLTLSEWEPRKTGDGKQADLGRPDDERDENAVDSRFVIVTDLGIIAKRSQDKTRDIFVQSIRSGMPVSDAKVSVVAKNGVSLLSKFTDHHGHVSFPSLEAYSNEQEPVLLLVEKEGDASFLPVSNWRGWNDRGLDYSRFDIGGDETPAEPRSLSSYLFSDRGVYRPGDTFNIGLITRAANWDVLVAGIPVNAEIRDPRNKVMATVPLILNASGFNELSFTTHENAPAGEWGVYVYFPGKNNEKTIPLGHTTVNVKEFEPEQLKVKLTLTPDKQKGWVHPAQLQASIDVQNLYGTPAQGRRVASKLVLRPMYPRFDTYPDFIFYENRQNTDGFETRLEEQTTDENGQAILPLDLQSNGDATYQLQLLSEAFVAGSGRSVAATARTLVSPHAYLVGVKADGSLGYIYRHAERRVQVIGINPALQKIALPGLKQILIERKYVSVLTKQRSGVYKYQSKMKEVRLTEQPLSVTDLGSDVMLDTQNPGNFVLQIEDSTGRVLNRVNYTVAGNANVSRSLDRSAELKLNLNKSEFQPGEEIEIAINAPYTGSGLITIEKEKVYSWQWFQADTTSSVQKIRIPEGFEGNGYINVQFVRDLNSSEIFMSPLSYGVLPFKVSNDVRRNALSIQSPDVIKPGQMLEITVKTDSPQQVALFAVDEGILQVARYQLNDPLEYFFRKRELNVESAQILDLILPEFSKLMRLTAAPGGDDGGALDLHLNPFKRKREKPVTYWSGITEVNGERTFTYSVPDYFNGNIRVMGISVSPDKIGRAQATTTVRDKIIMTPDVPSMVSPGDEFDVSVGVSNHLDEHAPATIRIHLTPPPQLQVVGAADKEITLASQREGVVMYRLRANALPGDAPLRFDATYNNNISHRTLSTSVRPAMPYRTHTIMGRMNGSSQRIDNLRDMFDAYARREALVSYSPRVLSHGLIQYLSDYPYSGSEQIVSRSISLMLQVLHPEMRGKESDTGLHQELKKMSEVLRSRQNARGGIGMWHSSPLSDPFVTPYVVQYLLEARTAGITLPANMLNDANAALRELAANQGDDIDSLRLRSWAVYLLTRQGEITTNLLASIQETLQKRYSESGKTDLSMLYLAASYQMLKMDNEADALLAPNLKALSKAWGKAWWTQNYYDPLVTDATRLYLIASHFPDTVHLIPSQVLENMVKGLKDNRHTTFSSAMSMLALERYSGQQADRENTGSTLAVHETLKDDNHQGAIASLKGMFMSLPYSADTQAIRFENSRHTPAWYVVTQAGYDRSVPAEAISQGLEISREYTDDQGNPLSEVTVGQVVNVQLKVRANSREGQGNLAIVDLLPGGFDVVQQIPPAPDGDRDDTGNSENDSDRDGGAALAIIGTTWQPDYSDIREDRVIFYGRVSTEVQTLIYQIKSTHTGRFTIPPAYGEALYDRDVQAMSANQRTLTVVPAQ